MNFRNIRPIVFNAVSLLVLLVLLIGAASAQTKAEITDALVKAKALIERGEYAAAVPYMDTLVLASPDDGSLRLMYGVALITKSKQIDDAAQAQKLSANALTQFKEAKRLGINDPRLDDFISVLSGNVSTDNFGTTGTAAEKYMQQAEAFFARSKYDEALGMYQKALDADPKMYEAALYMGDCYVQKQDPENAEKSYQKAIAIDPLRETAYRYSGTPLMKDKKYDQARDRYIEAYITEPYNSLSTRGITQWAEVTGAKLGHPNVDIPEIKYDSSGKPTTVMNERSLTPASKAWLAYSLTRVNWNKEKFAKTFTGEKKYRHSLQEEAEAIRSVLKAASEQKLSHPHFEILQKLDNEGLLEAYILLAKADEGIAQDHPAYLKNNRAKLRQYGLNYFIQK